MKILALNCRGLGRSEAVQEVCSLIQLHRPAMVFLSETRKFSNDVQVLRQSFGFANGVGVGSLGRGGGLALLWTNEICVKLETSDKLHIDVKVVDPSSDEVRWRFTGFYGEPRREMRHRSWELLSYLNAQSDAPWLCAGDFNEVLDAGEQFGGLLRPERQMEGFREAVAECGFMDLGFVGLPYTWDNRQPGIRNVKVRLDRALANAAFAARFKEMKVTHLQTTESDHCGLLIEFRRDRRGSARRRRPFKYENMWRRDPSYANLVRETWGDGDTVQNMHQLQEALGYM